MRRPGLTNPNLPPQLVEPLLPLATTAFPREPELAFRVHVALLRDADAVQGGSYVVPETRRHTA